MEVEAASTASVGKQARPSGTGESGRAVQFAAVLVVVIMHVVGYGYRYVWGYVSCCRGAVVVV